MRLTRWAAPLLLQLLLVTVAMAEPLSSRVTLRTADHIGNLTVTLLPDGRMIWTAAGAQADAPLLAPFSPEWADHVILRLRRAPPSVPGNLTGDRPLVIQATATASTKESRMDPSTKLQIVLCIAALVGSAAKAWATNSQATISKRSLLDVFIGGLAGLLVPAYAPGLIPQGVSLLTAGGVMCFVAYTSSDFIQNVLGKLGAKVDAKPLVGNGGPKEPPPPPVTEAEIWKAKVEEIPPPPPLPPAPVGSAMHGKVEYPGGTYTLVGDRWQWTPKPQGGAHP